MSHAPYRCAYCGAPSWVDPNDQRPPADYCGEHATDEAGADDPTVIMVHPSHVRNEVTLAWLRSLKEDGMVVHVMEQLGYSEPLEQWLNSRRGNFRFPTTRHPPSQVVDSIGVADGTRTHDDQNHNLEPQSSNDAAQRPIDGIKNG